MIKNVNEAIDFIQSRRKMDPFSSRERMKQALDDIGGLHKKLKVIHITGTNGKGSTSSYLSNIFMNSGCKVGLFTSPYVTKFNERIKINYQDIPDADLVRLVNQYIEIFYKYQMGFFEILTFLMVVYFSECKVDIAIVEVGIGGRYDATNIFTNLVSIVTNLSIDHIDRLGSTEEEILREKVEIIKDKELCVTGVTDPYLLEIIKEKTNNVIVVNEIPSKGNTFTYNNEEYSLRMIGRHQKINACLAIEASKYLGISLDSIKKGLYDTIVPGRIEVISDKPLIIVDVAHNKDSMLRLYETISEEYKDKEKVLIFGNLSRKELDYKDILNKYDRLIITTFDDPECSNPYELEQKINHPNVSVIEDINKVVSLITPNDYERCYVFAGSFRLITAVRDKLINLCNRY